jgi:hypothetical protein
VGNDVPHGYLIWQSKPNVGLRIVAGLAKVDNVEGYLILLIAIVLLL